MATEREHAEKATSNLAFAQSVDRERFPDWVVVGLFYVSVHQVEAMLSRAGKSTGSHNKRNSLLRRDYPAIWKQYQPLYAYSRLARYRCIRVKPEHVQQVERRFRKCEREIAAATR